MFPELNFPFYEIARDVLFNPGYVLLNIIFWVVAAITYTQYRRIGGVEKAIFGVERESAFSRFLVSAGFGLIGGIVGSFIFIFIGISIADYGVLYLWIIAIFLMAIQPRFMCFAYAAGILSIFSLLTGMPKVNIPSILGLVAVLHMVEGALIFLSGHSSPTPIVYKTDDNKVVGGFTMQKFWPIPIMILTVGFIDATIRDGLIQMPQWWPLISVDAIAPAGKEMVFTMIPVAAGLGYGDIALTRHPRERARISAINLELYSIVLLIIAVLSDGQPLLQLAGGLFAPIGHELVVLNGQKAELGGKPLYEAPPDGVMVLDIIPQSPAAGIGLTSGDIIKSVNGHPTTTPEEFKLAFDSAQFYFSMDVLSRDDKGDYRRTTKEHRGNPDRLGILLVPEDAKAGYIKMADTSFLQRLLGKLKNLIQGR